MKSLSIIKYNELLGHDNLLVPYEFKKIHSNIIYRSTYHNLKLYV
jgi:hypothetical protein